MSRSSSRRGWPETWTRWVRSVITSMPCVISPLMIPPTAFSSGTEVICHHDAAPHNVIWRPDDTLAMIDFDLASPGARIYELSAAGFAECAYDDLDAVRLTRGFLAAPERYLRAALKDDR